METFRLVFNGERCGDYAKLPIEHHLKLLKLSEQAIEKILAGNKVAIKSGLSRSQVEQQKMVLEKLGMVTHCQLQLNAKIFAEGLRLRDAGVSLSGIDTSLPVYELDKGLTSPSVINRPFKGEIKATVPSHTVKGRSSNYQINGLLLIAVAAFLGLTMQPYVVLVVKSLTSANMIATVVGILFLLACVVMLPRLFQPLDELRIEGERGRIKVCEQPELLLGKKRWLWGVGQANGEFVLNSGLGIASSGETLYQWNAHHSLQETSEGAISRIQDSILDGTIFDVGQTAYTKLKALIERFMHGGGKKSATNWELQPASVVTNGDSEVVALIYQDANAAYQILRRELREDLILHAFCLSIHRAGWV